jgi:hypothetical protein
MRGAGATGSENARKIVNNHDNSAVKQQNKRKEKTQMKKLITICAIGVILAVAPAVQAEIVGVALGTWDLCPPPLTLGGYTIMPFPGDPRLVGELVTSVPSPLGGSVDFGQQMEIQYFYGGWGPLGKDYYHTGKVDGDYPIPSSSVALILPSHTTAFYLYAKPEELGAITATAQDGTSVTQFARVIIDGWGAAGYGFYTTDGDIIASITVGSSSSFDFEVGEFGIAPEPATLLLLGLGALTVMRKRRA